MYQDHGCPQYISVLHEFPNHLALFLINWKDRATDATREWKVTVAGIRSVPNHSFVTREEADVGIIDGCEDGCRIKAAHIEEFEIWWRADQKKDKQHEVEAVRGYSRMGTYGPLPTFMSQQAGQIAAGGLRQVGADGPPGGTRSVAGDLVPSFS